RDAEVDFTRSSATAKLAASEAAAFIADEALQIHGGYGFTQDFPLERYVRDARIYRIYEGSSEIQRSIIARSLSKSATAKAGSSGRLGEALRHKIPRDPIVGFRPEINNRFPRTSGRSASDA